MVDETLPWLERIERWLYLIDAAPPL